MRPKIELDHPRPLPSSSGPYRFELATLALVALLAASQLAACGDSDTSPGVDADRQAVGHAGVERVTHSGEGLWGSGQPWKVDSIGVVLGAREGDDEYTFGRVSAVLVDPDERIFVADDAIPEVRVFNREGEFLARFGGPGQGPGEFGAIDALALGPDGQLVIRDPRLSRVSIFSLEGEFRRSFLLLRPHFQFQSGSTFWVDDAGRIYDRMSLLQSAELDTVAVASYGPDGSVIDTVVVAGYERRSVTISKEEDQQVALPIPYTPRPSVAVDSRGRIIGGLGATYVLQVHDRSGELLKVVSREIAPRELPPEANQFVGLLLMQARRQILGGRISQFDLPRHMPAYSEVLVDAEGYWWVGRSGDFRLPSSRYDVFDSEGSYLGVVETPTVQIHQIGDDFIAGRVVDNRGTEYAVVYPLRRSLQIADAADR